MRFIAYGIVLAAALAFLGVSLGKRYSTEHEFSRQAALATETAAQIREQVILFREKIIPSGENITGFLMGLGFDHGTVMQMVEGTRPVYDLRMVRAGHRLAVGRSVVGELRAVRYQVDFDRELWISPRGAEFHAEVKPVPSTTATVGVTGTIRDSLFNAIEDAGEGPELALQLADIFGWDLDFYTDPRVGDTFRVLVEKKTYRNGQGIRYGRVFAAEYVNEGHAFQAVLFRDPNGHSAYYAPDGQSLRKAFLRSPLKFSAPITSRFSRSRFHPILKIRRPHLGTDYAAPTGTPVQTIGDGRVAFAGTKGGHGGKTVQIQHANGYETYYMHLSRILVNAGERVSQGDRIGLVGQTGLATGPHLDFRIRQHSEFRNFETLRLPPALPVAKGDWPEFIATRDRWLAQLPPAAGSPTLAKQAAPAASAR